MRQIPLLRSATVAAAVLVLAGCASVDIDRTVADTNAALPGFTQGQLALARDPAQQQARQALSAQLLEKPLAMDDAVRLALANSPAVQALIAQSWSDMAAASQSGRIANPLFTFERTRLGSEFELDRLLSFGILDLLTLPERQSIARNRNAQARAELAGRVVEQVTAVRQAWVRAVAAEQNLEYAQQVQQAAEASSELARRMEQVGNFSRLQRARQHAFYADATARLAAAAQARTAAREQLVRQLGLAPEQAVQLKLPPRLPDLPKEPRPPADVNAAAAQQRVDLQLARLQLEAAGRAQRLDLVNRLLDAEAGVRHDTVFDNAAGTHENRNGFELAIRLPLFDWGGAQRAAMNAQSLRAASQYDAVARAASSQLRESYAAYRTAYDLAKHYRDEIVPLRKTISDENQLRYNGMLIGVFELLADAREQIAAVMASIDAQQQFWLADAGLASTLVGRPVLPAADAGSASASSPATGDAGH